jgi:hypothetical protein
MTAPSFENYIVVGYTTQEHLLVDLDSCSWIEVQGLARIIMRNYPYAGDCLIVESSENRYHLVFDDFMPWNTIVSVVEVMAFLGIVEAKYANVRTFRRDITLRVSEKIGEQRTHPVPKPKLILQTVHNCDGFNGIQRYLDVLKPFNPTPYVLIDKEVIE